MKTDPEESAFPRNALVNQLGEVVVPGQYFGGMDGLTKRELFAAMAMQGFCAAPGICEETYQVLAAVSVKQADALIAALNEPKEGGAE